MPEYGTPIRPSLPEGYSLADRLQREAYAEHHKVPGAARLAWVNLRPRGEVTRLRLAVLLRKPERWSEVADKRGLYLIPPLTRSQRRAALADYVAEYSAGWTAARLGQAPKLGCFKASRAYRDGWCDQREGRPKWHLAHCADHPACGA